MAIDNSITFGGINSADFGIYISGEGVFNAPQRDVEMISVPGRNGAIALDRGRFQNIEVTYPAFNYEADYDTFQQQLSDFRNAICAQKGYNRLSDTFHPDEYRMATYLSGLEVKPIKYNTASEFNIVFNCKPQRYLTSGEEEIDVTDWSDVKTLSGESVTFDDGDTSKGFQSIKTVFNPSQDGTPWKSEVESAPYLFRQSSGGTVDHEYNSESDAIVGGTVAWNQLVQNGNFASADGWYTITSGGSTLSIANNKATLNISTASNNNGIRNRYVDIVNGHKYLIGFYITVPSYAESVRARLYKTNALNVSIYGSANANTKTRIEGIVSASFSDSSASSNTVSVDVFADSRSSTTLTGDVFYENVQVIDLTALFGSSTIADYLYSLEQTTAGSGIAKLKEWGFLTKDYYAYDTGSLQSANVSAHETVGFNQWDEEWEVGSYNLSTGEKAVSSTNIRCKNHIPVIANTTYFFKSPKIYYCLFYDADKNYIGRLGANGWQQGNTSFSTPNNCAYITMYLYDTYGTTYNNDICINISDASRNGEYEPYDKHSHPLDSDLTLRGIPKLDASNNLYYDGDVYEPSGAVTRNFGIRAYQSGDESFADAITDGTNTVYKLSTPITETADPFTAIQTVDPYGTEEYIDYGVEQGTRDIAVPVGHQTRYIERVPIEGKTQMKTYVSPTSSVEDATEYTTSLNGTKYGGTLEVISGKLDKTHEGITYTGQTINEPWLSDCDEYQQGATPTYGATVVYELTTPTEVSLTGQDVAMLDGTNVVWADADSVEVKYGFEPGILYNPTRFDAQPLLEVEGDGIIYIGDKRVEISNMDYGEVELISPEALDSGYTSFDPTNFELLNTGDQIRVKAGTTFPIGITSDVGTLDYVSLIISSSSRMTAHFLDSVKVDNFHIYVPFVLDEDVVLYKGLSTEAYTYVSVGIGYHENGVGYNFNSTGYFRIKLTNSPRYGWGITINFLEDLSLPDGLVRFFPSARYVRKPIVGISTKSIVDTPMVIDCELGEAYTTDQYGRIILLNAYIDLGSDLPVLEPGLNEISYQNTITDLKVKPNWWKI